MTVGIQTFAWMETSTVEFYVVLWLLTRCIFLLLTGWGWWSSGGQQVDRLPDHCHHQRPSDVVLRAESYLPDSQHAGGSSHTRHDLFCVWCSVPSWVGQYLQFSWCMCWPNWQENKTLRSAQDEHSASMTVSHRSPWCFTIRLTQCWVLTVCLYLIGGLDVLPLESPSVDCLYLTGGLGVLLLDSPSVDYLSVSHRRPGCFTVRLAQFVCIS